MKRNSLIYHTLAAFSLLTLGCWNCSRAKDVDPDDPVPVNNPVSACISSADKVNLLYTKTLPFAQKQDDRFSVITIDTAQSFQTIDGFGYTLTGGSAYWLRRLEPAGRSALLRELFGTEEKSIGVSYLRISLGASDLDAQVFSYDDLPTGQTDPNLQHFNLSKDTVDLIPLLQEILAINPNVKIMGTPWSPPVWMKDNGNSVGGSLKTQFYATYAQYFVKYVQAMAARGIRIDAVTPQNEPQHGGNNPSMVMSALQQADFIKNHLGPAFQAAGISAKIVVWDHNCDRPDYPITILDDPDARKFVDGSAFHLYNGDEYALTTVHDAHPDKNLYFTEQWTSGNGDFGEDLKWHLKHVMIGTVRNWSRVALEWNLASDQSYQPHTPGGCTLCKGALTINGQAVTRNVSYYIVAQLAKYVPPGSVRLWSNIPGSLNNVAFRTPSGKTVLVVLNEGNAAESFNIHAGDKWIVTTLNPGSAGTFAW